VTAYVGLNFGTDIMEARLFLTLPIPVSGVSLHKMFIQTLKDEYPHDMATTFAGMVNKTQHNVTDVALFLEEVCDDASWEKIFLPNIFAELYRSVDGKHLRDSNHILFFRFWIAVIQPFLRTNHKRKQ
jgi:hypothetical protein